MCSVLFKINRVNVGLYTAVLALSKSIFIRINRASAIREQNLLLGTNIIQNYNLKHSGGAARSRLIPDVYIWSILQSKSICHTDNRTSDLPFHDVFKRCTFITSIPVLITRTAWNFNSSRSLANYRCQKEI